MTTFKPAITPVVSDLLFDQQSKDLQPSFHMKCEIPKEQNPLLNLVFYMRPTAKTPEDTFSVLFSKSLNPTKKLSAEAAADVKRLTDNRQKNEQTRRHIRKKRISTEKTFNQQKSELGKG